MDKWKVYTRYVKSPETFIEAGFYSMISIALQRKVWLVYGPGRSDKTFANTNIVLVGPAGAGKGLILRPIKELLTFHKVKDVGRIDKNGKLSEKSLEQIEKERAHDQEVSEKRIAAEMSVAGLDPESGNSTFKPSANFLKEAEPLIKIGPDNITYRKLLSSIAAQQRAIFYQGPNKEKLLYTHCSYALVLSELSSLMNEDSKLVNDFFLAVYDSDNYEYETQHCGSDKIYRIYINLLAGTTPNHLEDIFTAKALGDGISARFWFVYGAGHRFRRMEAPIYSDPDQQEARRDILEQLKNLASPRCFGPVEYAKDAQEYLRELFVGGSMDDVWHVNKHKKLTDYYTRKDLHTHKLAMAIHFSNSTDKIITYDEVKLAVSTLARWEQTMHLSVTFGNKNPVANCANKIKDLLAKKVMLTRHEIVQFLFDEVPETELMVEQALKHLMELKDVSQDLIAQPKKAATYYYSLAGTLKGGVISSGGKPPKKDFGEVLNEVGGGSIITITNK